MLIKLRDDIINTDFIQCLRIEEDSDFKNEKKYLIEAIGKSFEVDAMEYELIKEILKPIDIIKAVEFKNTKRNGIKGIIGKFFNDK